MLKSSLMDASMSWLQPEQEGPAAKTWLRVSCGLNAVQVQLPTTVAATSTVSKTPIAPVTPVVPTTIPQPTTCPVPVFPLIPANGHHPMAFGPGLGVGIGVTFVHPLNDMFVLASRKRKKENPASTYGLNYFSDEIQGQFGGYPWAKKDTCYRGHEGLHDEIEHFYRWMQPNPVEHAVRTDVIKRVEAIILALWPDAEVQVYGSFQTGLYLPTSDIDIAVIGKWNYLPFRTLEKVFVEEDFAEAGSIKVLDKATVPIIKLTDKKTEIRVDISFNMSNGLKSANLIKEYKKKYPVLQKLVYVLKQFLLQRDLNEVFTGGISSYSLILMCISFLQLHPNQAYVMQTNEKSLGVLLIQFFELYGREFNYMKVGIKITNGGSYISKDCIQKDITECYRSGILCIEDPLTPDNDIGRSSYGMLQVRRAFDYAYNVLLTGVNTLSSQSFCGNSILSRIIRISDDVIFYRHLLFSKFRSQVSDNEINNNSRLNLNTNSSLSSNCSTSSDESNSHSESSDKTSNHSNNCNVSHLNGNQYPKLTSKPQKYKNNLQPRMWQSSTTVAAVVSSTNIPPPNVTCVTTAATPTVTNTTSSNINNKQPVNHVNNNTKSTNLKTNHEIIRRKKNKTTSFPSRN